MARLLHSEYETVAQPPRQACLQDLLTRLGGGVRDAMDRHHVRCIIEEGESAAGIAVGRLAHRPGIDQVTTAAPALDHQLVAQGRPSADAVPLQDEGAREAAASDEAEIDRHTVVAATRRSFPP